MSIGMKQTLRVDLAVTLNVKKYENKTAEHGTGGQHDETFCSRNNREGLALLK